MADQKLSGLLPANYQKKSQLIRSLLLAIDCIGKRIALRKLNLEI